ncbi:Signal transduction histidine kinase [Snodgrassella alvi SCGC AB-598-J21]|uniref:histidine kinase n=1 Tax=Snodgrassella alvi SCGC AB-598-J21 TaxID=1385367 RepID=A0A074VFP2_9NEIS|nr:Signal transduction histidine kinase [Snodgrassella alvi SCGC AB-598-J21]
MAGRPTRIVSSLQWRLLLVLTIVVTSIAIIGDILAYQTAFRETQDLQDAQLEQIAHLLDPRSSILRRDTQEDLNFPESARTLPKPRVLAQTLDSPYLNILMGDDNAVQNLQQLPDGFHNFTTVARHWRVYLLTRERERIIVAQRTAYRNHIAKDSALSVVWPFLILMPILWLFTAIWIRRLFRATQEMSSELTARNANDLSPLDTRHVPTEIRPFITALNRLFSQLQAAMEHDKKFISHAAHELRTPITALTLQIARFDEPELTIQEQHKLIEQIKAGIARTEQLLIQLLSMARAQHQQHLIANNAQKTALMPLLRDLIAELLPLAEQKKQNLSFDISEDVYLPVSSNDLYTILKNILSNAIKYTPVDGQICIGIRPTTDNKTILLIEDNGQGISETERQLVFEPFYRILGNNESGSGLGLAIVKTLCDQWHISISLADSGLRNSEQKAGLAVSLIFSPDKLQAQNK